MKIWVIKIGEPAPNDADDTRLYRTGMLAQMLAEQNHTVTWWTSTVNHYQKEQRFHQNTTVKINENLDIVYLHSLLYQKNISISRIINHIGTARQFEKLSKTRENPDIILCCLPILELCEAAIRYGKEHNVPVVIDVRDLWPDIFLEFGKSWSKPLLNLLLTPMFNTVRSICTQATGITGVTPEVVDWALEYANRSKSEWDQDFPLAYAPEIPTQDLISQSIDKWKSLGICQTNNKFIACFCGTMGKHSELETLIEAAYRLKQTNREFQFVLCGSGDRYDYYRSLAKDCDSIIFPGWVGKVDLFTLMKMSSVGLASYASTYIHSKILTNKPIEYMSCHLPIVSSLDGKLKSFLSKNQCGITHPNRDVDSLVNILIELYENPQKLQVLSTNAKITHEKNFCPDKVYGAMIKYLESLDNSVKQCL
ncbi:MAG: glycosyltransferase family 4 protein [Crocosphaera sp.]